MSASKKYADDSYYRQKEQQQDNYSRYKSKKRAYSLSRQLDRQYQTEKYHLESRERDKKEQPELQLSKKYAQKPKRHNSQHSQTPKYLFKNSNKYNKYKTDIHDTIQVNLNNSMPKVLKSQHVQTHPHVSTNQQEQKQTIQIEKDRNQYYSDNNKDQDRNIDKWRKRDKDRKNQDDDQNEKLTQMDVLKRYKKQKEQLGVNESVDTSFQRSKEKQKQKLISNRLEFSLQVHKQNKNLRKKNKDLKKQLEQFQRKLDISLKKQLDAKTQKKVKLKLGQQIVQNMQLRNAYKMCEIYKKQINHLKRKQAASKQERVDQLENMVFMLQKQKQGLKTQIKDLKKANKQQEKGIKQISGPNSIKIMQQNQRLRDLVRKLQFMKDNKNRDDDKQSKVRSNFSEKNSKLNNKLKDTDNQQSQLRQSPRKKSRQKLNTERSVQHQKQKNKLRQQVEKLKDRLLKETRKINSLTNQNIQLKQFINEMKGQIVQKDREFNIVRQKLINLKKQVQQSKNNSPGKSDVKASRIDREQQVSFRKKSQRKEVPQNRKYRESNQQDTPSIRSPRNTKQQTNNKKKPKHKSQKSEQPISSPSVYPITQQKYPRIVQAGYRSQTSQKWNHHQFSSKIKQIHVYPHPLGHIRQLNFVYQKGIPARFSIMPNGTSSTKQIKYASFSCQPNNNEYIKYVKGGFKNGLLRYIKIVTNKGRKSNFCQCQLQNECINFQFGLVTQEYPIAFFGQNIPDGICRVGCFLQYQKQQDQQV